jgi:hypothetical protein
MEALKRSIKGGGRKIAALHANTSSKKTKRTKTTRQKWKRRAA